MHSFSQWITAAILGSACLLVGCGKADPAPQTADEKDLKLPEFYGVYAVADGGTLIEINPAQPPAVVPAAAEFIVYEKGLAAAVSEWHLTRLTLGLDGAATEGADVAIRRKGVSNQPDMIRIQSTAALEPGEYQIRNNLRFVVSPEKLRSGPIVGQWIDWTPQIGVGSAITFNKDGTYEIVLIASRTKGPGQVQNETGTWTLDAQRLTTTSTKSNDGRPPGTVDVLNVERLAEGELVLQDPQKLKSKFRYVRATPAMLQAFSAASRGEMAQPGRTGRTSGIPRK